MPLISYILCVFFCFLPQFIEYFSGLFWQNCHFWATVTGIYHFCCKLSKMAAALFLTDKCLWVVLLNYIFVALSPDAYNAFFFSLWVQLGGWPVSGQWNKTDFNSTLSLLMGDYATFPFFNLYVGKDPKEINHGTTSRYIQASVH